MGLASITIFEQVVRWYALNPRLFQSVVNQNDVSALVACLPPFLGMIAMQGVHELGHIWAARRHRVKLGLPTPIPSFQLGFFGAITPVESFPPSRTSLLDLALSGPVAGILSSIGLMVGGTLATVYASAEALSRFPVVNVAMIKGSFFVGGLMTLLAPKVIMLPSPQPIPIHPAFLIGFVGLITNALNMLPMGRLDGGRAYTAIFGARSAARASIGTMLLIALSAIGDKSSVAFLWWFLVFLFQRKPEIPLQDGVSDVDDVRVSVFLAAFAVSILALLPFPGGQGFF